MRACMTHVPVFTYACTYVGLCRYVNECVHQAHA